MSAVCRAGGRVRRPVLVAASAHLQYVFKYASVRIQPVWELVESSSDSGNVDDRSNKRRATE